MRCCCFLLLHQELFALHPHDLAAAHSLDQCDDLGQTLISHVLQLSQKACLKEHLESQEQNMVKALQNV